MSVADDLVVAGGDAALGAAVAHQSPGRDGEARRPARSSSSWRDGHARPARSRCSIWRHSPTARSTSTATTLIPPAATSAPTSAPMPFGRVARARALQLDQRVADQTAGEAAEQDGDEGGARAAGEGRAESGPFRFGHALIVRPCTELGVVGSRPCALTVVVPTYNEIENIERLLRRGACVPPPTPRCWSSTTAAPTAPPTGPRQLGAELGEHRRAAPHRARTGWAHAYRAGLRAAIDDGAEICVQMDADLSHDPAVLPALIANVEHGADLAIGSRYVPGGRTVELAAAAPVAVAVGQPLRGGRARAGGQRRHRRVPRLSQRRSERMEFETVTGRGLRLPGGDDLSAGQHRRQGGRVPDQLPATAPRACRRCRAASSARRSLLVLKLWVSDFRGRRRRRADGRLSPCGTLAACGVGWSAARSIRVTADGLVLVGNRRRDQSLGVDPARWRHRPRRDGAARASPARCARRPGSRSTGWAGLRYTVTVDAPDMGWRLRVEAWEAIGVDGEVVVADPDGIVEQVRQVGARSRRVALLPASPPWVHAPVADMAGRLRRRPLDPFRFRVDGADRAERRRVERLA